MTSELLKEISEVIYFVSLPLYSIDANNDPTPQKERGIRSNIVTKVTLISLN